MDYKYKPKIEVPALTDEEKNSLNVDAIQRKLGDIDQSLVELGGLLGKALEDFTQDKITLLKSEANVKYLKDLISLAVERKRNLKEMLRE